jgi:transposase
MPVTVRKSGPRKTRVGRPWRLTETQKARILADHGHGLTYRQITKKHQVSPATVYNILLKAGITGKRGVNPPPLPSPPAPSIPAQVQA